ncbi:2Fe-2S iron-sulfur cluster binding domain-containing protein [Chitinimonas arctica]|uniref:2Fe-2S iron-sulfur cluster binding domain-containing protein n=1 Tax=Chitinimonas arctica TaxID=2594795 RepID=A0A516SDS6_9NEIS|nr:2Fe-2S iron-sulfur cluster-binding protein [Chitinimonas arctica]QDQ26305.1 2Fe-2S iron-sulfur cluster binding domain-containing protein [Chitinimonas arctica]
MTLLVLQGGGMRAALEVHADDGSLLIDAVRELSREGRLPLYWRCGQGTCGACVVRLQPLEEDAERQVVMTGKERNVLARLDLLDESQRQAASLPDHPDLPRLACHVRLPEGVLKVNW